MYEPLLFIHSWTRWLVIGGLIYFLAKSLFSICRKRMWTPADNHFIWAFNQIFGYQVLFGFFLWMAASPFLKLIIRNPDLIYSDSTVSFWSLRHPLTMIIAFGIFHVGKARARKASLDKKFKIFAITFALIFGLIGSAIPWIWMPYGRPWISVP